MSVAVFMDLDCCIQQPGFAAASLTTHAICLSCSDLTEATLTGAWLSIVAAVVMFLLLVLVRCVAARGGWCCSGVEAFQQ